MAEEIIRENEAEVAEAETEVETTEGEQTEKEKTFTQSELNEILEERLKREKDKQKRELENAKAEAEKLAKMNEQQKSEYEIEKLKRENEALKREHARIELGKTASDILKEKGIDATNDILDFVVGDNADDTKANIDKFVAVIQAQVEAAEVRRSKGTTPKKYKQDEPEETSPFAEKLKKYKS